MAVYTNYMCSFCQKKFEEAGYVVRLAKPDPKISPDKRLCDFCKKKILSQLKDYELKNNNR